MNRRYLAWHEQVFAANSELLVVTGLQVICNESSEVEAAAACALEALAVVPRVHVAIVAPDSLAVLGRRCSNVRGAWLVGDCGDSLQDPTGQIVRSRRGERASVHAVRDVLTRLPRSTATLLGADVARHITAVAAVRARPRGVAFHVEGRGHLPPLDLVDGVVHGAPAWVDLLARLQILLTQRRSS